MSGPTGTIRGTPFARRTTAIAAASSTPHAPFRADIQGVRALAVLMVILFHAGVPGFSGGYAGVDVFFVVSGFLICGLLQRELVATGGIDLGQFWARRVKRLMPNAVLLLLTVLVAVALIQPIYTHREVASAVAASAFYYANLHFAAAQVDYFVGATPSPVLHFWSLSVEEQFYVVWPLSLFLLAILLPRRLHVAAAVFLLGLVAAVSLIAAQIVVATDQPTAFYHSELRAWQFALGGLLAVTEARWAARAVLVRSLFAAAGLLVIAATSLLYGDRLTYPGLWALPPTLATVAVLAAPSLSTVRTMLSHAALGWIGDRSYSLYLWHWPALVMMDRLYPANPMATALAVLAGVLCALLAYELVEAPLRQATLPAFPRLVPLAAAAVALASVSGACWLATQPKLLFDKNTLTLSRMVEKGTRDRGRNIRAKCHRTLQETDQPLCEFGDVLATRTVILFGDSHAAQWLEAVDSAATQNGWRLLAWTKSACPPIDALTWHPKLRAPFTACDQWREGVMARMTGTERPDLVLISAYVDSGAVTLDENGREMPLADGRLRWRDGMASIMRRLQAAGVPVTLIADTPRATPGTFDCLARGGGPACDRPRQEALPTTRIDHEAARLAAAPVLDLTGHICGPTACPAMLGKHLVYRDAHHLTASFSKTLGSAFLPLLPATSATALRGPQTVEVQLDQGDAPAHLAQD